MINPAVMAGMRKAQANIEKSMGAGRFRNATDQRKYMYGFKIPNLAYQIYVRADHLPFAIHGESAPPHVGKSMLAIEKGIWAIKDGCYAHLTDTEHKHSIDMVESMMRVHFPKEFWEAFKHTEAYSVEEWMQINTNLFKAALDDKGLSKPDRYGIYNITDSLLGAAGQDSIDKILKEGFAQGRGYKEETLSIKNYCEAFDIKGAFFAWNTVQHAKKSLDPNARGVDQWNAIGGDAPRFSASTHSLLTRAGQVELVDDEGLKVSGHNIKMQLLKNGVGGEDRRVGYAGLRWRIKEDPETGESYQETWFDWDWSLGYLLSQQTVENTKVPASFKKKLKSIIQFTVKNKNNVTCKKYGDKALTYSEFGRCIEEDEEVREAIKALYGVKSITNYKDADVVAEAPKKKGKSVAAKKVEKEAPPPPMTEEELEDESLVPANFEFDE